MVPQFRCAAIKDDGHRCQAPRLREGEFCLMHSPDHAEEVQEARRLGGLRRKRDATLGTVYDLEGLDSADSIRRLIEIAVMDVLGLDNSIARARVLLQAAQVAARILETSELEQRIRALESFHSRPKGGVR